MPTRNASSAASFKSLVRRHSLEMNHATMQLPKRKPAVPNLPDFLFTSVLSNRC
jgi:hypothetical protein